MKTVLLLFVLPILGCLTLRAQTLTVNLGPDMLVCADSCVTVGPSSALVADGYIWSTGDTTRNINYCLVGTTDTTLVLFAFDSAGNVGSDTVRISVAVCNDSVWPGDADNNGVCDVYDITRIGQGFGFSGLVRPGATTNWIGQPSINWAGSAVLDYKYADCDGNGTIQYADFQVVQLNYGLTHAKSREPMDRSSGNPVLRIQCEQDTLNGGDTLTFKITLGDSVIPVTDFYALAFTATIETDFLTEEVSFSDYNNNFVGSLSQNIYAFDTTIWNSSLFEMGFTRYDHVNVTGHGELGTVSYILIDDIAGKLSDVVLTVPVRINFVNVYCISEDGTAIPLDVVGDTVQVRKNVTGINETIANDLIKVYPNPATNVVTIEMPSSTKAEYVEVYNNVGALVSTQSAQGVNTLAIDTKNYPNGYYILKIKTAEGWATKRFSVIK